MTKAKKEIIAWAEIRTPIYTNKKRGGFTMVDGLYIVGKTKKAILDASGGTSYGYGYNMIRVKITPIKRKK